MNRLFVLLATIAALVVISALAGGSMGLESHCVNGQCDVSVSSSLASTLVGILLIPAALLYPQRRMVFDVSSRVQWWRRLLAFWLDMMVVLAAITPLTTLPILLAEQQATGVFEWSFSRRFARETDALLMIPGILFMFVALYVYFWLHPKFERTTVGQYVLGYTVAPVHGAPPSFFIRPIFAFIGLSMWPISLYMAAKRLDQAFWWDKASVTRVVRTKPAQTGA